MIVLGIETSCDECSAAVVEDGRNILSNVIATQIELHKPYQGVVPELASRLHTEWIEQVVAAAVRQAGLVMKDIDAVAFTNRPGLLGSLLVGTNYGKALAATLKVPFIGIDHIRGHLYASQIENPLEYPYLGVRIHKNTPVEFIREVCRATQKKGNSPVLFNDETIIARQQANGASAEEARDYCGSGYSEARLINRDTYFVGAEWLNLPAVLEMALNDGFCSPSSSRRTGKRSYKRMMLRKMCNMEVLMALLFFI